MEHECFGLPNGNAIVGAIVGVIVILVGLGLFLQASGYIVNFWNYFWPIVLIIIGVLIVIGVATGGHRRHS